MGLYNGSTHYAWAVITFIFTGIPTTFKYGVI